jgi:hypothetical protein
MLHLLKRHVGYFSATLFLSSPAAYAGIISHNVLVKYGAGNRIGGGSCCGMYSAYMEYVSRDGSAISATR